MDSAIDFALDGLDLHDKTILDAATGAGRSTAAWAAAVDAQGGSSRIISVDHELSDEWRERILERLGDRGRYVELHEWNIFDLAGIENGTIDIVNCHDTLVFLNQVPLRVLRALAEFRRVLKPGGLLIITSETPVPVSDEPAGEGQWRRWNLAKAIHGLTGEVWAAEIDLDELLPALELLGFEIQAERRLPPRHVGTDSIFEWREIMQQEITRLPWDGTLREALAAQVEAVARHVEDYGKLLCPATYVVKARRTVGG